MLKDFIKRPTILDKVDQRPNGPSNKARDPDITVPAEVMETPIASLSKDAYEGTEEAIQKIKDTIIDIKATNSKDPSFIPYSEYLDSVEWDPTKLLSNPKYRPQNKIVEAKVKKLERQVYLNTPDNRAPFLQELYRSLWSMQIFQYAYRSVWTQVPWPETPLAKFTLYQVQKGTLNILGFNDAVGLLGYGRIRSPQDLVRHYITQLSSGNTVNLAGDIEDAAQKFRTALTSSELSKLNLLEEWEKNQKHLHAAYGNQYQAPFKAFARASVLNFVVRSLPAVDEYFENLLGIDIPDTSYQSVSLRSIEDNLVSLFKQVQGGMSDEHRKNLETEELRNLMVHNVVRKSVLEATASSVSAGLSYVQSLSRMSPDSAARSINQKLNEE